MTSIKYLQYLQITLFNEMLHVKSKMQDDGAYYGE